MLINKSLKPFLSDLYEYDFSACFYSILKNIGYDVSNIDSVNKVSRNIQIGILQKNNPLLSSFLHSSTAALIDYYLDVNQVDFGNVVWRQKDGIILTAPLKDTNSTLPIEFRGHISKLISSLKKDKILILYDSGKVTPKGILNKTIDMSFYDLFAKLNFSDRNSLIYGLEDIRKKIFESDNINWFARKIDDSYYLPIIGQGTLKFHRSSLQTIQCKDIDKTILWDSYVWPFCQTLMAFYD